MDKYTKIVYYIDMKTLLGLVLLGLMGCGTTQNQGPVMFAYGDSVTYGAFTNNVSYVTDISQIKGYSLTNKAVSGSDIFAPNQYAQMMSDDWSQVDYVFFTPGANDSFNAQDPTYISNYTQALVSILTKAQSSKLTFYLGTPLNPINDTGGFQTANIQVFANINRQVLLQVNSPNIILIDFNLQYQPTASIDADLYHPNAQGYQIMTNIFFSSSF